MKKVNLGCGAIRPEGWDNYDGSLNALLQKQPIFGKNIAKFLNKVTYDKDNVNYINLNKKWKFKNDSIDIVYSSHTLEHLTLNKAELFISESYRCLKKGGVLRIVVPDLYQLAKKYVTEFENGTPDAIEYFLWALNMHREGQYGDNINTFKKIIYEKQGYPHQHKYMYDEKSLMKLFEKYGFQNIINKEYGISDYISDIIDVEGKNESYLSIYIEAIKPN